MRKMRIRTRYRLEKTLDATLDTFSRLMHVKHVHNRVMTNKILFIINLVDLSTGLFCNREESVVHALFHA